MKLSIITCTYNSRYCIEDCIQSVRRQIYPDIEHIIQDGSSTDGTFALVKKSTSPRIRAFQSVDTGIYDALNKGIFNATGDVIGLLHSDDLFAADDITKEIMQVFEDDDINIVYGDLVFVDSSGHGKTRRYWRAGPFKYWKLVFGWMPPHPTIFIRKKFLLEAGLYDTGYRISGDYEAFLRWAKNPFFRIHYMPKIITRMKLGGVSTKIGNKILKTKEDYRAVKINRIGGLGTIFCKNIFKLPQLLMRRLK